MVETRHWGNLNFNITYSLTVLICFLLLWPILMCRAKWLLQCSHYKPGFLLILGLGPRVGMGTDIMCFDLSIPNKFDMDNNLGLYLTILMSSSWIIEVWQEIIFIYLIKLVYWCMITFLFKKIFVIWSACSILVGEMFCKKK